MIFAPVTLKLSLEQILKAFLARIQIKLRFICSTDQQLFASHFELF